MLYKMHLSLTSRLIAAIDLSSSALSL